MSTGSSRSAFARVDRDLTLPESLREDLKRPLGPVLRGAAVATAVAKHRVVIAVGDFCAADLLSRGVDVRVAVVDGKTLRRGGASVTATPGFARFRPMAVTNAPGTIARESWRALDEAFKTGDRVRLQVIGEEDLLTLPAILLAPDGACVVYGQPGEGAVVVPVGATARRRVRDLLGRMV